jgi:hypothetical protein
MFCYLRVIFPLVPFSSVLTLPALALSVIEDLLEWCNCVSKMHLMAHLV